MKSYRFSPQLYLERFGNEAVLLVAEWDRLLTVNAAAADLFTEATRMFGARLFSLEQGVNWLTGQYALSVQECRVRARALLIFGLRHGLVRRADNTFLPEQVMP